MTRSYAKLVTLVLLVGVAPAAAQFAISKKETPDRYVFAPPLEYEARYERDEGSALIKNPDFFCTACAKEGRIAAQSRRDMRDELEFVKKYPAPVDGETSVRLGKFMLMQEKGEQVLTYLFEELPTSHPVFIEDGMFRLFCDLPSGPCVGGPPERRKSELAQLKDVFPELKSLRKLSSHQRAHLMLVRSHRIRRDFEAIVDHDPRAGYMSYLGPWLGSNQKFEVYVFDKKKKMTEFILSYLGRYPTIDGFNYAVGKKGMHQVGVTVPKGKDAWINGSLTHRLSHQFVLAYRGYHFDFPAWFRVGLGHLMERRESTRFNTLVVAEQISPNKWMRGSWKSHVKKAVQAHRFTRFEGLVRALRVKNIPIDERAVLWSRVSFLISRHPDGVKEFIHRLKAPMTGPDDIHEFHQKAFEKAFGMNYKEMDEKWCKWVTRTY